MKTFLLAGLLVLSLMGAVVVILVSQHDASTVAVGNGAPTPPGKVTSVTVRESEVPTSVPGAMPAGTPIVPVAVARASVTVAPAFQSTFLPPQAREISAPPAPALYNGARLSPTSTETSTPGTRASGAVSSSFQPSPQAVTGTSGIQPGTGGGGSDSSPVIPGVALNAPQGAPPTSAADVIDVPPDATVPAALAQPGPESALDPVSQKEAEQLADQFVKKVDEQTSGGIARDRAWRTQQLAADDAFRARFGWEAFNTESARASYEARANTAP